MDKPHQGNYGYPYTSIVHIDAFSQKNPRNLWASWQSTRKLALKTQNKHETHSIHIGFPVWYHAPCTTKNLDSSQNGTYNEKSC